jgi:CHASE2 domain-containing sensor protein
MQRPAELRRHRRVLALLAVVVLAWAAGALLQDDHILRRAEQWTLDARYQLRGSDPAKVDHLVLVAIDDATFDAFRNAGRRSQWPFPRRYHARVIERLKQAGAKVIGFDVQFTAPSNPRDDGALMDAIGAAGNVVLSTTVVGPDGTTNVLGGDGVLRELHARAANTSVIPDTDGAIRSTQFAIAGLETFGAVLASARPFDGRVPIDYAGPPGTVRTISYARVYDGRFDASQVAGKTVIVGATAASLQDLHQTPVSGGAPMAGIEVLANAAATIRAGLPLRTFDGTALIAVFVLVVGLAGLRFGALGVTLTGLAVLALWTVAAQIAFEAGTIVDYSDPAAALLLATGGASLVGLWADNRERRRLREAFAASSHAVVDDVLSPAPRTLEPTAIIAGYRIEAVVGRGGMGVVYRATQLALDRQVAIKLIADEHAQDPVFRERFERESRLAASIEHVNVIPVYEAGEDDGLLYIVMRLVDGVDLAQVLEHDGALEPQRALRVVTQLASALDAAHAHGLVHRDVKPANVLLTAGEPEHVHLTDFGVAKQAGAATQAGWAGTLDYLAPEQIRGEPAEAAGDVYAVAALLHQCMTGDVPFPRDSDAAKLWAHVNARPPAPSRLRAGLPPALDVVIARGLAKDPAERYARAGELARACAEALGAAPVLPASRPARTPHTRTVVSSD